MSDYEEQFDLTAEERAQAFEFWDALMFATTPVELDATRLRLMGAPAVVQRAVMTCITWMWLREYEPRRSENPFMERGEESLGTGQEVQEMMVQEHQEQSIYHECSFERDSYTVQTAPALLANMDWLNAPLDGHSPMSA